MAERLPWKESQGGRRARHTGEKERHGEEWGGGEESHGGEERETGEKSDMGEKYTSTHFQVRTRRESNLIELARLEHATRGYFVIVVWTRITEEGPKRTREEEQLTAEVRIDERRRRAEFG